jgi:hypothetical protein
MIDRRRLLESAGAALVAGTLRSTLALAEQLSPTSRLHPVTRSLLERARDIDRTQPPDRDGVERSLRNYAVSTSWSRPLVIDWMDGATDVHEHLSSHGLDALLQMGSANFWRRSQPVMTDDEQVFNRCHQACMEAKRYLDVVDVDQGLMAPKLLAKTQAVQSGRSDRDVFQVRAVSAQIGWLETSIAAAAARAIENVELLLVQEPPALTVILDQQIQIFELHEQGLLATWEAHDRLICIPTPMRLTHRMKDA